MGGSVTGSRRQRLLIRRWRWRAICGSRWEGLLIDRWRRRPIGRRWRKGLFHDWGRWRLLIDWGWRWSISWRWGCLIFWWWRRLLIHRHLMHHRRGSIGWRRWWWWGWSIAVVRTVVTLAPGVDNVDVHEGRAVASLHHLVADLLQQHQGQQASHHQGLQTEILGLCKVCKIQMYVEKIVRK